MDNHSQKTTTNHGDRKTPWSIPASIALLVVIVLVLTISRDARDFFIEGGKILTSGDEKRISGWVDKFGFWGPLMIVFLMVLQMFLLLVPSWLLMVVAVLAYGPWWGGVIAVVAVLVASSFGYGVGNMAGEHGLEHLMSHKALKKVEKQAERYGIWAIIVTRINPLLSNDAISLVAGLVQMGFWKFLGATLVGILPLAVVIAVFGDDWQHMKTTLIWVSVVSLLGLGVKIYLDRRKE